MLAAVLLYGVAPILRAVVPLAPDLSPVRAAFVYAAMPEEALKLAGLAVVVRRRSLLLQATGIACGFATVENVLAIAYAPSSPFAILIDRVIGGIPAHLVLGAWAAGVLRRTGLSPRGFLAAFAFVAALHTLFDTLFFAGHNRAGIGAIVIAGILAALFWRYQSQAKNTGGTASGLAATGEKSPY